MSSLGVLLAAGESRRFGTEDKLLAPWRGRPLVATAAAAMANAGCDGLAAIVSSPAVAAVLPADFVPHRVAAGQPMAVSFRPAVALAEASGATRLLICLGDMPGIEVGLLERLLAAPGSAACLCDGIRLPPMALARADFTAASAAAEGDRGARRFLAALPATALIPIAAAVARDIDTPDDLSGSLS